MEKTEIAVFGSGCFWCSEAVFSDLRGVLSVMPGYAGGEKPNPTYDMVCSGTTGHAEVIRIEFDPQQISFSDLLTVFFATHDPTTLNRQGNDVGTQYRSVILYTTPEQKMAAEKIIAELDSEDDGHKIVTQLAPLTTFYEAEAYHHQYYKNNSDQPYCQVVISPKLKKLKERYAKLLKTDA